MPITVDQIVVKIRNIKPCSRRQALRYLERANVKPLGVRTRPRLYPDAAPQAVLDYLGLRRIPTLNELRAERRKAQRRAV